MIRSPRGSAQKFYREVVLAYGEDRCLVWPFQRDKAGYARSSIRGVKKLAHRMVCEELYGPPPTPWHHAAHSCGNGRGGCVAPRHLSWKTKAENEADKVLHGTDNRGTRHGMAKLDEQLVVAIRALRGQKTIRSLAKEFGVSPATVCRVQSGQGWAHI